MYEFELNSIDEEHILDLANKQKNLGIQLAYYKSTDDFEFIVAIGKEFIDNISKELSRVRVNCESKAEEIGVYYADRFDEEYLEHLASVDEEFYDTVKALNSSNKDYLIFTTLLTIDDKSIGIFGVENFNEIKQTVEKF